MVWTPVAPGVWNDDGVYLLIAKSLAQGDGLVYAGVPGEVFAAKFPPAYPVLASWLWRLGPPFPRNAPLFAGVNFLLLAGSGVILARTLVRALGVPSGIAAGIGFLALLPGPIWTVAAVPLSESLFTVTFLAALGAGAAVEAADRKSLGLEVLFLLLFGLAVHVRTVGVVVAPALVLALLTRRRIASALRVSVGSTLVVLPWTRFSGAATAAMDPGLRDLLGSYGAWWVEQVRTDPSAYLRYLGSNGEVLVRDATALLLPGTDGPGAWALAVPVWLAVAAGLWWLWRTLRCLPLALGGYSVLVWAWPFQSTRLLAPVAPWLVASMLLGVALWARSGRGLRFSGAGFAAGAAALVAVTLQFSALVTGRPWRGLEQREEALSRAVRSVEQHVPPEGVVGAPELWAALHLYTGRRAAPSARFLPLQQGAPSWGSPQQQVALWRAEGVDYLLLEHAGAVHGEALTWLEEACPGTASILDTQPGMLLVRLEWDAACVAASLPS